MRRTLSFVFSMIIFLCFINSQSVYAKSDGCYVLVEKAGNFDPTIILNSTVSMVGRYIEEVKVPPPGGLRMDACIYSLSLTESMDGFLLSLSGKKINAMGDSKLRGMKGFTQALLRAIFRSIDNDDKRTTLCRNHGRFLTNDCKPVEAVVFLFNENGRMIPSGSKVRENDQFNIMIQPVSTLYAYVISRDSGNNLFKVFPNPDVSHFTNPLQAGSQYYFPAQNSELIFAFDDNPGKEKIYFLLSSSPMNDMEQFFRNMKRMDSDTERQAAAPVFEEKFATRGIRLKKSRKRINFPASIQKKVKKQQAIAELLEGRGILVKTISLEHLP
ncbi:MAG: DUF4384 domain-containing protein [Proteobacteria bacterium]|nr:DUF4384 domain-containing protein [Pseudomonadota bacterium]